MPGVIETPRAPLYRVGRAPDPLAWTPWRYVGQGRFDDPRDPPEYRVLYAGERLACFYEVLAAFRVDLAGIAAQGVTPEWLASRRVATFTLPDTHGRWRWLDLRSPATYGDLRTRFGAVLAWLGYSDFDLSVAANDDRGLSQLIGLWANLSGYQGIRYPTRHHPGLSCWAIFEGTPLVVQGGPASLTADDPDLQHVAATWKIPLPNME